MTDLQPTYQRGRRVRTSEKTVSKTIREMLEEWVPNDGLDLFRGMTDGTEASPKKFEDMRSMSSAFKMTLTDGTVFKIKVEKVI
jgi:hypothetical protein